jgi:hypothetical protein
MDIVCLQLSYRKKEITTCELTNQKQMEAYTVPTKVRGQYPVEVSKQNITNGSLHCTH